MRKIFPLFVLFLCALLLAACKPDLSRVSAAEANTAQSATATSTTPSTSNAAAATQAIATGGPEMLTPTPAGSSLAGTSWIMSSLNGSLPAAETSVTLQFGTDGYASGSDGCNRYMTTYKQDGQNLTFAQPMGGTMMACAELTMNQADQYREALEELVEAKIEGHEVTTPAAPREEKPVTSLADALRASLAAAGGGGTDSRPGRPVSATEPKRPSRRSA